MMTAGWIGGGIMLNKLMHLFGRRSVIALLAVFAAAAAMSCTLVGQGDLHVANDLSGIGRDNTTFHAYAPEPGDVWPPAGYVNIFVTGDDFGTPPSYGMNGYV